MKVLGTLLAITLILLACTEPRQAKTKNPTAFHGQYGTAKIWTQSPKADHQRSVVIVTDPATGSTGSGCIVQSDGPDSFVITNEHVVRSSAGTLTVIQMGGERRQMQRIWSSSDKDLAVLHCTGKLSNPGLPVFTGEVPIGATVEMIAFGGPGSLSPEKDMRHVVGKRVEASMGAFAVDVVTVSGDSGGPFVYGGGIVGVNWGYPGTPKVSIDAPGGPWGGGSPATSGVDGPYLDRTLTGIFSRFGCRLGRCTPNVDVAIGSPSDFCPPTTEPYPPSVLLPECPDCDCEIDYEKIVEEVLARLPPVIIQPTYVDQDNRLQAFGQPVTGQLGEVLPLPPMEIEVQSATSMINTRTQIPIGGRGKLRLGQIK